MTNSRSKPVRTQGLIVRRGWLSVGVLLAWLSFDTGLVAQTVLPERKDSEIVINPTLAECDRGWTDGDQVRWSKELFDVFCATIKSPTEIVANPTVAECARGWEQSMRWSKERFGAFCQVMRESK